MGAVVGLYTTVQKDQKQNEAKTVQTTENTKLNIAVVNEDKAVKLNDKEYNLGASYVKNIERDNSQTGLYFLVEPLSQDLQMASIS